MSCLAIFVDIVTSPLPFNPDLPCSPVEEGLKIQTCNCLVSPKTSVYKKIESLGLFKFLVPYLYSNASSKIHFKVK